MDFWRAALSCLTSSMSVQATILIVDDEARNRDLIEAILKSGGYRLETAADGQEALAKTIELRPDLILLDVMMPDITGFEVCQTIREDPDLADIPVILVTALDDRKSRLQGIEAGADDFLSKPVDSMELKARVKTVVRLNRFRRLSAERDKVVKIADFSSDALFMLSRDNLIQHANESAGRLLHADQRNLIGADFKEATGARFVCQPPEAWKSWVDSENPDDRALRYLMRPETAKGPAVWLQVHLLHVPDAGGGDWLVRLQDVSGLINQKRNLWNTHRMLSHKLRTPMNGLLGSLSVLVEALDGDDRDLAQTALESADRLDEQVKDVVRYLDAPKLARGGDRLNGDDIRQKAEDLGVLADPAELQIQVSNELSGLSFDLGSLAMDVVFAELFANSAKFHPDAKPRIKVVADRTAEGGCEIQVMDDGRHIESDVLRDIRKPYFQGETKLTGEVAGMGLGLAMISSIIWEVGGTVKIGNREDSQGVRVALHIPPAKAD